MVCGLPLICLLSIAMHRPPKAQRFLILAWGDFYLWLPLRFLSKDTFRIHVVESKEFWDLLYSDKSKSKSKSEEICQNLIKFTVSRKGGRRRRLVSVKDPLDVSFAQFLSKHRLTGFRLVPLRSTFHQI